MILVKTSMRALVKSGCGGEVSCAVGRLLFLYPVSSHAQSILRSSFHREGGVAQMGRLRGDDASLKEISAFLLPEHLVYG